MSKKKSERPKIRHVVKSSVSNFLADPKLWHFILNIHFAIIVAMAMMQIMAAFSDNETAVSADPQDTILAVSLFLTLPLLSAAYFTNRQGLRGIIIAYQWKTSRKHLLLGAVAGLAILALTIGFNVLLTLLGFVPEETANQEFVRTATLGTAFILSIVAAFSEELYFRGYSQQKWGYWVQAFLFSALHFNLTNPVQTIIPFIAALGFGLMMLRKWGLWSIIIAHFMFNFTQFALVKLAS